MNINATMKHVVLCCRDVEPVVDGAHFWTIGLCSGSKRYIRSSEALARVNAIKLYSTSRKEFCSTLVQWQQVKTISLKR